MDGIALAESIPDSVLPYPDGSWNRVKYFFWRLLTPWFPAIQGGFLRLGVIQHPGGRGRYLLGHLAPGIDASLFVRRLEAEGVGNHFIAWTEEDQVLSLRKLDGFEHQYHLRIFGDGEVRGHYEYTPEAHPVWHQKAIGIERRREDLLRLLGDLVVKSDE